MKKLIIAAVSALALTAAVASVFAIGASRGGTSSSAALAAAQGQTDVFSSLTPAQDSTPAPEDQRPWLGARVVRTPDGPTVEAVIADSPADKGGLKRGDVIKSVDGTSVGDMDALLEALKGKKPGDTMTLSISRDGNLQDITVTLEARPEPLSIANPVFPELNGIPKDGLFSHLLGGSFQFTGQDGSKHTATVDLGTVSAVDTNAKTISVDLNAGGSKTYTITDGVTTHPKDLSQFQSGDKVTVVSVDGDLRAVSKGPGHFLPFFGKERGHGGHHGGHGEGHHGGGDFSPAAGDGLEPGF